MKRSFIPVVISACVLVPAVLSSPAYATSGGGHGQTTQAPATNGGGHAGR